MYENVKQKKVCKEKQWVAVCTKLYSSLTPTIAQLVLYITRSYRIHSITKNN